MHDCYSGKLQYIHHLKKTHFSNIAELPMRFLFLLNCCVAYDRFIMFVLKLRLNCRLIRKDDRWYLVRVFQFEIEIDLRFMHCGILRICYSAEMPIIVSSNRLKTSIKYYCERNISCTNQMYSSYRKTKNFTCLQVTDFKKGDYKCHQVDF